jgi:hypothetical protein
LCFRHLFQCTGKSAGMSSGCYGCGLLPPPRASPSARGGRGDGHWAAGAGHRQWARGARYATQAAHQGVLSGATPPRACRRRVGIPLKAARRRDHGRRAPERAAGDRAARSALWHPTGRPEALARRNHGTRVQGARRLPGEVAARRRPWIQRALRARAHPLRPPAVRAKDHGRRAAERGEVSSGAPAPRCRPSVGIPATWPPPTLLLVQGRPLPHRRPSHYPAR